MADKVRVGVLGCARITKSALLEASHVVPEIEVAAVASRDAARARDYAQLYGIGRAYGGYQELLNDPDIDVIYNPLPNSMHLVWSLAALKAGKAVLCEKPLASNAREARELVEAAQRYGRPLIEAFHYRHHPMAKSIVAHVRSGELGRISRCDVQLKIPERLLASDDIRFQFALSGGAMMDLGSYGLNILRLILGEGPRVLTATATLAGAGVDGAMDANLIWPNGARASLGCSLIHDSLVARLTVEGDRGTLVADNPFIPQRGNALAITIGDRVHTETFDLTPTYVFQLRSLAAVVRHGVASPTPGEDGVANMKLIDEVYSASGLGPRGA